ncbi:MAG: hypothetical protein Q9212_004845 [Teloschistes hypoglaucus]
MFRKPRDVAEASIDSSPIKPSTGRAPTPPNSIASGKEKSMELPQTSLQKTPTPLLGRSKTTPRSNSKTSTTGGGKMGGKSNGSILSFFKKATPGSSRTNESTKDEDLFLGGPVHDEAEDSIQTPTPPGDFEFEANFPRDAREDSPLDLSFRYNEIEGPVKRRRVSADIQKESSAEPLQPDSGARKGPFVDESSDEENEILAQIKPESDHPSSDYPMKAAHENNNHTTPVTGRSASSNCEDATVAAQTLPPSVPPLKRETTSYADGPNDGDVEDFIDDEYVEGEEYMERRWMEEQAELEMGLGDEEEPEAATGLFATQDKETGPFNVVQQETMSSCPICDGSFGTMSANDASKHVNDCLDGKAKPLSAASKPVKTERSAERKPEVPNHKRFQRAAIARPGQDNPFDLASAGAGGSSAFSKLMSGHAEDAAWATAAATEAASRGKPAYQRTCPFYKILPGLSICVDAFRYGAVEGCKAYFLSHFHSDHYIGLTSSWCHGPIYCSRVTANLVRRQLRVDPKWVVDLEFEQKVEVPGTGVNVTMIPANHCPGSSLYLYEKVIGKGKNPKVQRVLHCGDFRACPAHVQHPLLRPDVIDAVTGKNTAQQKLDVCYLDTTYLTPKYAFPSQEEVIKACADMCVSLSKDKLEENDNWEQMKKERAGSGMVKFVRKDSNIVKEEPDDKGDCKSLVSKNDEKRRGRLLVIVGTYSIGKERICLGVAKALNSKIFATPNKQKICAALEDPELMSRLTNDPLEAQVHMQMLMEIRAETLADYLTGYKPHFSRIVGFRPSGWNYRPPNSRFVESPAVQTVLHSEGWKSRYSMAELMPQRGSTREAQCFGVPYSEHSSFRELTMFCCALRIDKIIPTVNVGSAKSRERMKGWCDKWAADKKKNGLFKVADGQTAWS